MVDERFAEAALDMYRAWSASGEQSSLLMSGDPDGWMSAPIPQGTVHVRVRRRADGRLVITDLYLNATEITSAVLRDISMARLDAAVNMAQIRALTGDEPAADAPEPTLAELRSRAPVWTKKKAKPPRRRKPLTRPDGTDPAVFYRQVAEAYQEYVVHTRAPATRIAQEADVPVTTAHRWIREARRRGFLPPARKGRAG